MTRNSSASGESLRNWRGRGRGDLHGIPGPEPLLAIVEPDRADAVQDVVELFHGTVQMPAFGMAGCYASLKISVAASLTCRQALMANDA